MAHCGQCSRSCCPVSSRRPSRCRPAANARSIAGRGLPGCAELYSACPWRADDVLQRPEHDLRQAASLLRSAHRAGRLTPRYQETLETALNAVLPPATLRTRLAAEFEEIAPISERSDAIAEIFRSTLRTEAIEPLLAEIRQINRIHEAVGPVGTVGLIEHVKSSSDMRRIRLIAEAGGDRTVALEKQIGEDVLGVARTGVKLSRSDVLEIMGLAAAAMAVFWMALAALQRSLSSRRQGLGIL